MRVWNVSVKRLLRFSSVPLRSCEPNTRLDPKALIVAAALALTGCAAQVATLSEPRAPAVEGGLQVVDARQAADKKSDILSLLITNCNYGIYQAGDDKIVPSRLDLLRDDLNARLGAAVAGKTLTVTRYWIHFNNAAGLRGSVYASNPGLVSAVMKPMGARCPREKMRAGWYAGDEVENLNPPFIVEIQANLDGNSHAVRVVYSSPEPVSPAFGQPASAKAMFVAMRKATDALAAQMR